MLRASPLDLLSSLDRLRHILHIAVAYSLGVAVARGVGVLAGVGGQSESEASSEEDDDVVVECAGPSLWASVLKRGSVAGGGVGVACIEGRATVVRVGAVGVGVDVGVGMIGAGVVVSGGGVATGFVGVVAAGVGDTTGTGRGVPVSCTSHPRLASISRANKIPRRRRSLLAMLLSLPFKVGSSEPLR